MSGGAPTIPCTRPKTTAETTTAAVPPQIARTNAEAREELLGEGADQDDEGRVDRERRSVLRLPPVRGEALLPAAVQDGLQDARHHECCDDDAEAGQIHRMRKRRKPSAPYGRGKGERSRSSGRS